MHYSHVFIPILPSLLIEVLSTHDALHHRCQFAACAGAGKLGHFLPFFVASYEGEKQVENNAKRDQINKTVFFRGDEIKKSFIRSAPGRDLPQLRLVPVEFLVDDLGLVVVALYDRFFRRLFRLSLLPVFSGLRPPPASLRVAVDERRS
jgi:hypothetical protein